MKKWTYYSDVTGSEKELENTTHMKTSKLVQAVIPGVIAIAAFVLSLRSPLTVESLVGYGSVLMLLAVVALEYRVSWKRIFGR